jgi:hypothetical protein
MSELSDLGNKAGKVEMATEKTALTALDSTLNASESGVPVIHYIRRHHNAPSRVLSLINACLIIVISS